MMKKLWIFVMMLSLVACSNEDAFDECVFDENVETFFTNSPLPVNNSTLRILAIGNSYTVDATERLGDIVREAGIPDDSYCVYRINYNSASLKHYDSLLFSDESINVEHPCGNIDMEVSKASLREIFGKPWDIVVFQQFSGDAVDYSTYNPYLNELISAVQNNCPNDKVCFAWHLIWSYRDGRTNKLSDSEDRWRRLCQVTQYQIKANGIDVIIPTGTAIQNARNTVLQNKAQLTRDGTHLDVGVGRYIAACTFFERIFAPVFGTTVMGNPSLYTPTNKEMTEYNFPATEVNASNAPICQQCAVWAVEDMFTLHK